MGLQQTEQELSDAFKKIGRLLSENMGTGIAEETDEAKGAMDKLTQELLESQQYYLSEKTRIEQETEAAEEAKYQRDYQNRLSKAKTAAQAEIVRQNEQLRLQKKANKEYLEALEAHLELVEKRIKEEKTRIVNEFNQIAEKATESLEALEKARQKMASKMVEYGGLFEEKTQVFLNTGPNGSREVFERTILDLSEERAELEKYSALLQEVQGRADIPAELFNSIRDLSVSDAIQYQEALLALSDTERAAYLDDWKAIQELSAQTARSSYAEDTKQVLNEVETELEKWYGTIPEGFLHEGELSADAFGTGFANKMNSLQTTLQDAMGTVMTGASVQLQDAAYNGSSMVQNTHNTTYILNNAGDTVSQQLQAASALEAVKRLRGLA